MHRIELQAFIDAIGKGKLPEVDAFDGYIGLKLALAATESYKTGKPVKISID